MNRIQLKKKGLMAACLVVLVAACNIAHGQTLYEDLYIQYFLDLDDAADQWFIVGEKYSIVAEVWSDEFSTSLERSLAWQDYETACNNYFNRCFDVISDHQHLMDEAETILLGDPTQLEAMINDCSYRHGDLLNPLRANLYDILNSQIPFLSFLGCNTVTLASNTQREIGDIGTYDEENEVWSSGSQIAADVVRVNQWIAWWGS